MMEYQSLINVNKNVDTFCTMDGFWKHVQKNEQGTWVFAINLFYQNFQNKTFGDTQQIIKLQAPEKGNNSE